MIASLPASTIIQASEKLRDLLIKGRKKGKLDSAELSEVLDDMDLESGRAVVDAKSLLGLMNLGLNKEIELKVYDENCQDLFDEISEYFAA